MQKPTKKVFVRSLSGELHEVSTARETTKADGGLPGVYEFCNQAWDSSTYTGSSLDIGFSSLLGSVVLSKKGRILDHCAPTESNGGSVRLFQGMLEELGSTASERAQQVLDRGWLKIHQDMDSIKADSPHTYKLFSTVLNGVDLLVSSSRLLISVFASTISPIRNC